AVPPPHPPAFPGAPPIAAGGGIAPLGGTPAFGGSRRSGGVLGGSHPGVGLVERTWGASCHTAGLVGAFWGTLDIIAAKIGGDAATTVNNNTPDFGFGGQKRQLEDGGKGGGHTHTTTPPNREYRVPDGMVGLSECGGAWEAVWGKAKLMLDDIVSRGRGGPPGQFHDNANGQNGTVQEIMIPAGKAGLVIGKGGETIKQLQERAGVKMILIQDGSQNTNVDKPLRIIGDPYKVQQACEMVMDILRERDQGGFGDRNEYGSRIGGGIDVPVPRHSVGVVIGRSGEMIKKIQNDAGVRIQFKQDDGTGPEKIAHIMGPPERCEHAARIINDLLQSLRSGPPGPPGPGMPPGGRGRGRGQGSWGPPGGEMTFSIPTHKCGLVIGRGEQPPKLPLGDPDIPREPPSCPWVILTPPNCPQGPGNPPNLPLGDLEPPKLPLGDPDIPREPPSCPWVILTPPNCPQGPGNPPNLPLGDLEPPKLPLGDPDIPREPPSCPWVILTPPNCPQGPGNPPNLPLGDLEPPKLPLGDPDIPREPPSQQPQQPGAPPQQDYTKAWEEYYKKQAAQVATGGGPGAPPGPQPDYSAAWAEYYRQQAAYYGQTPGAAGPAPPPTQQGQQVRPPRDPP
uniref:KH-type splicing regulatory protein n=1 Tax=Strix occidentalis caurina TaxID=311401 RepID=A0A8D0G0K8_STROC